MNICSFEIKKVDKFDITIPLKLKTSEMKKSIWYLVFLIGIGCSETGDSTATSGEDMGNQIPEGAALQDYPDIPGLQKATVYSGDKILREGDFLNGLHHGTWTVYDSKGKVQSITTYYKGKKQGTELVFDNQGYVSTKSYYYNDQLFGEYLKYKRRNIVEKNTYNGGVLDGLQQKFYTNGTVMEESNYVNGTIDGVAKWYDQDGNLTIEYTYDMGKLVEQNNEVSE
jgi:hypothetical protein